VRFRQWAWDFLSHQARRVLLHLRVGGSSRIPDSGAGRWRHCPWTVVVSSLSVVLGDSWAWGPGRLGGFLAFPRVLDRVFGFYILGESEKMLQVNCESRVSGTQEVHLVDRRMVKPPRVDAPPEGVKVNRGRYASSLILMPVDFFPTFFFALGVELGGGRFMLHGSPR
jgi:hypothetical protein